MKIFETANLSTGDFDQILSFLRAGGVIGFPTDTAYGLGADPFNEFAVRRVFEIKGRPEAKPILVLVDSLEMVQQIATISETAESLARQFWPGPLTMILPAHGTVPRIVTAGTGTIGVRWPRAPFATRLVGAMKQPITATSANKSGQPPTGIPREVLDQLGMDLEMLIDGGELLEPQGSTILDLTTPSPTIVREGPVTRETLSAFLDGNLR